MRNRVQVHSGYIARHDAGPVQYDTKIEVKPASALYIRYW